MTSKKQFFSILSAAVLVGAFSAISFGQEVEAEKAPADKKYEKREGRHGFGKFKGGEGKHGRMGKRHGMGRMLHGIDLTDVQKEQIKAIREANKPDAAVMAELRTFRESRKTGTELTVEQKARMTAIHEQMRVNGENVKLQMMNILTAEQKAQIEERKAKFKQNMQERKLRRQKAPAVETTKVG